MPAKSTKAKTTKLTPCISKSAVLSVCRDSELQIQLLKNSMARVRVAILALDDEMFNECQRHSSAMRDLAERRQEQRSRLAAQARELERQVAAPAPDLNVVNQKAA
jgi:hypothetical protein